jgi:hypothetical protein
VSAYDELSNPQLGLALEKCYYSEIGHSVPHLHICFDTKFAHSFTTGSAKSRSKWVPGQVGGARPLTRIGSICWIMKVVTSTNNDANSVDRTIRTVMTATECSRIVKWKRGSADSAAYFATLKTLPCSSDLRRRVRATKPYKW